MRKETAADTCVRSLSDGSRVNGLWLEWVCFVVSFRLYVDVFNIRSTLFFITLDNVTFFIMLIKIQTMLYKLLF